MPAASPATNALASTNRTGLWGTLLLVALSWYFWDSPFLFPIRMFVVLLHELGHATAALLTGGEVLRIELLYAEGGAAFTSGGSRFLILNAGYLGSLVFGCLLLVASRSPRLVRPVVALVALVTVLVTLIYLRPLISFSFLYGAGASLALFVLARHAPLSVQQVVLRFLGLFSCLYALFDIRDDVLNFERVGAVSDATMLAGLTGIPAPLWGFGWFAGSVLLLYALRRRLFL